MNENVWLTREVIMVNTLLVFLDVLMKIAIDAVKERLQQFIEITDR